MALRVKQSLAFASQKVNMNKIKDLRLKIDEVDEKLLELVIKRLQIVQEIGRAKNEEGIGIIDKNREEVVLEKLTTQAEKKGIDPEIVKKIWKVLIEISYYVEGGKNGNS